MRQPIRRSVASANQVDTTKWVYTLLCDGNNLLKISLVNHRINEVGKDCGGVVTFLSMLGGILDKKDFDYCITAWDGNQSGILRYRYYKDYKANRDKNYSLHDSDTDYDRRINEYVKNVLSHSKSKKEEESDDESFERQKGIINSILEELCVRQYEFDSVEGDDIISYYVKNKRDDEKVVIVSSDKDLTQLISDTVIVYNPRTKTFITKDNCVKELGIRSDNVVVEKILCGDSSDNIKGVKGIGEKTLVKLFPQMLTEKVDLETVIELSRAMLDKRKEERKKPLKSLENIVNGVTDGIQGNMIYEINKKIIDLSEPLLTDESRAELDGELYSPLDVSNRKIRNIYAIVNEYKINDLMDENRFGEVFSHYQRVIKRERERYDGYKKE